MAADASATVQCMSGLRPSWGTVAHPCGCCLGGAAGKCYHGFSNDDAITFYQTLNQEFNDGNINNLFGLDQFAADDTEALVLTAKMSLLQITIYQQLIMMGSTQGENTTMMAFAATAADRIGVSREAQACAGARPHASPALACCSAAEPPAAITCAPPAPCGSAHWIASDCCGLLLPANCLTVSLPGPVTGIPTVTFQPATPNT
jgi:hypothetical protein